MEFDIGVLDRLVFVAVVVVLLLVSLSLSGKCTKFKQKIYKNKHLEKDRTNDKQN